MRAHLRNLATIALAAGWLLPDLLAAQTPPGRDTAVESVASVAIDGPAPPLPPAVVARDSNGRTTVRAVRLSEPLRIDGRLDEAIYETIPAMTDFVQQDPIESAPATEKTEVWVFFDDDHVFVVGRCWDSQPERMIINEMRRDGGSVPRNENFAWMFDTFYDRRNGVFFEMTPLGGRMDAQVTNERSINTSWNPVWDFATGRFPNGWVVEAKIPFKSLRYRPGTSQVWGFQVRRKNQWKNEVSYLSAVPASIGEAGHFRAVSLAATLVGLEAPSGSANLEIKPYAISNLTTDPTRGDPTDLDGDFGLDVKYGVTQNLTADFTYRTDFAQVEADEQQVNLTRFSLFFPEKREFFLENQGTFEFGGAAGGARPGTAIGGGSADTPTFFYSRRIGLDEAAQAVPIVAGGRLTGRVGRFNVGLLNLQTDDVEASGVRSTNFSVVRIKRDVLRKSSIGVIYTGRSVAEKGIGANHAYGVDGTFGFYDNLTINTSWAQTQSTGRSADDVSYRGQIDYAGDRYGVQLEHLRVGANFNPEIGFVRRPDMRRHFGNFRFSPRPRNQKYVRKLYWTGSLDYIESGEGRLETRIASGAFQSDFQNGDRLQLTYTHEYEYLPEVLQLTSTVAVPIGAYQFQNLLVGYAYAPTRKVASGAVSVERGSFFDGDKTTVSVSQGRLVFPPYLSLEPTYSLNKVDVGAGRFTTHLAGTRVNVTITPLMFVGALLQYNSTSHSISSNVRFRWEYQPGSELFIVYNDQRDTLTRGFPALQNRAFIVKINRLFRP
jgi:hypothetical protein